MLKTSLLRNEEIQLPQRGKDAKMFFSFFAPLRKLDLCDLPFTHLPVLVPVLQRR